MSENLSGVDSAQLEQWAYGRATTLDEQERAGLAAAELQRRVAAERERAERDKADRAAAAAHALAVANGEVDGASREHPKSPLTDPERRHRRRMLATGIAGVTAAALALGAGAFALNHPNPDPLAIFEREETELDRDWADRLARWGYTAPFIDGPRVVELDDGIVAVVARISTVPDGRSTEWDAYCLYVGVPTVDFGAWSISAGCTYPERFALEGLTNFYQPSDRPTGVDAVSWGPSGPPQVARDVTHLRPNTADNSVLDWLAYAWPHDSRFSGESLIDDPARLLMGPTILPLLYEGNDYQGFNAAGVVAWAMLVSGERPTDSPMLCVHVEAGEGSTQVSCSPLDTVRREGVEIPLAVDGLTWIITIEPDGRNHTDTVRLLDE